ncbi:hypothetical protein BDV27DRAFT_97246 [Aspergillus caelatus]|uniref:Uncharacterized protein n=1 Tax=Aspergillus caelatus TaxID=61420 RepID=A0A5N7AMT8_9EURO|nr:uncharacterized protein BDV27DRAFT_97246 [Aspergillus caelatus]KAE8370030.1 hypothetical protein BDV27DRAFT_97246 [Aspergillus caelatus]
MECFRQIGRLVKAPFQRDSHHRALEIGHPTNFRKEEMPTFFPDDESVHVSTKPRETVSDNAVHSAQTLHSHSSSLEKDAMIKTLEREPSTRQRIKNNVRRLSIRVARPVSEHED